MKKIILTIMIMTSSFNGFSNETLDLGSWIDNEIEISKSSLLNLDDRGQNNSYKFSLKGIILRVRASVGIDIPFIAKAKIKPEIEFFWTK